MKYEDYVMLFKLISRQFKADESTDCVKFMGVTKKGYGRIRRKFGGKLKDFYTHRIAKIVDMEDPNIGDCSHLCHQKLCVNPKHISVESKVVNNHRKYCFREQKCIGHLNRKTKLPLPNCIFFK